jgi:hypothetical protein
MYSRLIYTTLSSESALRSADREAELVTSSALLTELRSS